MIFYFDIININKNNCVKNNVKNDVIIIKRYIIINNIDIYKNICDKKIVNVINMNNFKNIKQSIIVNVLKNNCDKKIIDDIIIYNYNKILYFNIIKFNKINYDKRIFINNLNDIII